MERPSEASTADNVVAALQGNDLSATRIDINELLRLRNPDGDELGRLTDHLVQLGVLNHLIIDDAKQFAGLTESDMLSIAGLPPTVDSLVEIPLAYHFADFDANGNGTLEIGEIIGYADADKAKDHHPQDVTSDSRVALETGVGQSIDPESVRNSELISSTNQDELVKVLENADATAAQKLGAVQQLAGLGLTQIDLTDSDGTIVNCRIDVGAVGNSARNYVQLFAENVGGKKERILLRGIESNGEFSQEIGQNGPVGFTGDWWSRNHSDSALDAQ
ncbi:hypothetical protein BH10CYA1_BH10CYA1_36230 [soil metagenome]